MINAGIGATGSEIANYRVHNDLLRFHPDLVFIDFSVNDPNRLETVETYEGLIRQVLKKSRPISLILPKEDGKDADMVHPNNAGHELIFEVIFKQFNSISFKKQLTTPFRADLKTELTENKYEKTRILYADQLEI